MASDARRAPRALNLPFLLRRRHAHCAPPSCAAARLIVQYAVARRLKRDRPARHLPISGHGQALDMDSAQSALLVEAAAKRTRDAGPRRFTDTHFPADASSLRHDWCEVRRRTGPPTHFCSLVGWLRQLSCARVSPGRNRNGLGPPPVWVDLTWRRLPSIALKARML